MKFSVVVFLLSIVSVIHAFGFHRTIRKRSSICSQRRMSLMEDVEDEEEIQWFSRISETYLRNKFQACDRPEGVKCFFEEEIHRLPPSFQ